MENPCNAMFFGDSITKGYTPMLEKKLIEKYPEIELEVINAGVSGETSRDGIQRLQKLLDLKPVVVVIGFGMNDWRKKVSISEFSYNINKIVDMFEQSGVRVILSTVIPSFNFKTKKYNDETRNYSNAIRKIADKRRIKLADIEKMWETKFRNRKKGLVDDIHPTIQAYEVISNFLMQIIPRKHVTILWQYNGKEAVCNYRCPYCYYVGLHNPEDISFGGIDEWKKSFLHAFGKQNLVFYLGHGEPTMGEMFPKILDMIASVKNWKLRIISNVSLNLDLLANSQLAKEGRLFINASYHPTKTNMQDFLSNIILLRDAGIEVSVVYVAYPIFIPKLKEDIEKFSEYNFLVHVRRFQGVYRKKSYPWAFSDKDKQAIAKYSDDYMIKYMLNQQKITNNLSFSGFDFFIVDNVGNVGYDSNHFEPYNKNRVVFGNIHTRNFKPLRLPGKYPGKFEGTADGVANLVSSGMKQLENNNVISFAKQGGVYLNDDGKVVYSNVDKDFDDPTIRAEYNFLPRNVNDYFYILRYSKFYAIKQQVYQLIYVSAQGFFEKRPKLLKLVKRILRK